MSTEANAIINFIEKRFRVQEANNTLKVVPFILHDHQKELIRALHHNTLNVISHPRCMGVTTTVLTYLAIAACMNSDHRYVVLSPTKANSRVLCQTLSDICDMSIPGVMDGGRIDEIRFLTGSSILFGGMQTYNSTLCGVNAQHIYVDNIDFCDEADDAFMATIVPCVVQGRVTFASTPHGASPLFRAVQKLSGWNFVELTTVIPFDPIKAYDRAMKGL